MKIDPSKNIPTASSKSEEWVQWHKDLKKIFGKKKANSLWILAWAKRGGVNSPANTNALSSYMKGEGVDIQRTTWEEIGESISDIGSGIFTVWKWASIIGMTIVGLILLRILMTLLKDPNRTIQTAVSLTPEGKALMGAKALTGK